MLRSFRKDSNLVDCTSMKLACTNILFLELITLYLLKLLIYIYFDNLGSNYSLSPVYLA